MERAALGIVVPGYGLVLVMFRKLILLLVLWTLLAGPGLAIEGPPSGVVPSTSGGMTAVSVDLEVAGPGGRIVLDRPGSESALLLPVMADRLRPIDPRALSLRARLGLGAAPAPSLHTRLCVFLC